MYRPKYAGVERRPAWPAFALKKPSGLKTPQKHVEASSPKDQKCGNTPKNPSNRGHFHVWPDAIRFRAFLCGMCGLQATLKLDVWVNALLIVWRNAFQLGALGHVRSTCTGPASKSRTRIQMSHRRYGERDQGPNEALSSRPVHKPLLLGEQRSSTLAKPRRFCPDS